MVKCREKILCILFFREKAPYLQCSPIETGEKARRIAGIFYALSYRIVPSRVER
nr:MAG TPA: hypothetical protein [Caudoviricetes sp.]